MATPSAAPTPDITFQEIRERAYDLWERHHRPEGFSIALWLMAERELRAEREARRAGKPLEGPAPTLDEPAPIRPGGYGHRMAS